jgi:tRNA-splicing endonuclease subunit Sen2
MGKRNNLKLYNNALPITLSPEYYGVALPQVIPHNPISWVLFACTYLYIQSKPVPRHIIKVDLDDDLFKVTSRSDMMRLWTHGFFGKGSLSRSDPSWAERTAQRLGINGSSQYSSEEITKQRREERRLFKLERAKVQDLELKARQQLLSQPEMDLLEVLKQNLSRAPDSRTPEKKPMREEDAKLLQGELDLEYLQLQAVETFFLQFALNTVDVHDHGQRLDTLALFARCCSLDASFAANYAVYHHFRSLGWCARSGVKFGCDYLLYKRGPPFSHAEFAVLVIPTKHGDVSWIEISTIARVVGGVKKNLVLCYVDEPDDAVVENMVSYFERFKVTEVLYRRWTPSRSRD